MQSLISSTLVVAVTDDELQLFPDMAELVWGIFAFAVLLAFMLWKVFPKVNQTLDERAQRIQGQITEAEAVRTESEELRRQYEARLAEARSEANRVLEDAKEQAERLKAEGRRQGEEEAAQIVARAREDAEAERSRLLEELRGQVAVWSVELAGRIVQRELDEAQHRELVDQYINELAGLN